MGIDILSGGQDIRPVQCFNPLFHYLVSYGYWNGPGHDFSVRVSSGLSVFLYHYWNEDACAHC